MNKNNKDEYVKSELENLLEIKKSSIKDLQKEVAEIEAKLHKDTKSCSLCGSRRKIRELTPVDKYNWVCINPKECAEFRYDK